MKLEDVQSMWEKDSVINYKDIPLMDSDTVKGGSLHSKYANILGLHKIQARKLEMAEKTLQYRLEQYYINNLYCEELGRKPSPKSAKTKGEAEAMIAADPKMVNLLMQIAENDEICLLAKEAMEYIRWNRTKDITNHIEWLKWHNGQM